MKKKLVKLGLIVEEDKEMRMLDCHGTLEKLISAREILAKAGYKDDTNLACFILGQKPATETEFSRLMVCLPNATGECGFLALA